MNDKKVLQVPTTIELEGLQKLLCEDIDEERVLEKAKLSLFENLELLETPCIDGYDTQVDMDLIEENLDLIIELEGLSDNFSISKTDIEKDAKKGLQFYKEAKKRQDRKKIIRAFASKAAIVVLIFSFSLAISDNVLGFNIIEIFKSLGMRIGIETSDKYDGTPMNLDSIEKVYQYTGIEISAPKYLPEGYKFKNARIEGVGDFVAIMITYTDSKNNISLSIFNLQKEPSYDYKSEKDDPDLKEYVYKGVTHNLKINIETSSASWLNKTQVYELFGILSEDELKNIINSTY